ncbi:MAG: TonB-dependent receptor [Dysgonomonas sp.]|nr:TonB-dependent receptor [Dysgonomonas sp.]
MKGKIKKNCKSLFLLFLIGILSITTANAQNSSISGVIKDAQGEPIIGASVVVKGTTNGTVTDLDGNFQINANQGNTLVISYIGYKPQEIIVQNQNFLNITLQDDTELLSEVVVIGYGSVKKEDLTGSVTAIDASSLAKGLNTSASDMLVGKAPGVTVTSDGGAPGSNATIRIRGGSSMSASNDPLIVIDGVPVDNTTAINGMANPLATIHPNDIETFTVLKDASATAIYGSRASNGVIIITTKKGQSGKLNITYNGNLSVSHKSEDIDVMDAGTFRNYITETFGEGSPQVNALGKASTDWQKEIFRTAVSTDHNLSFSGTIPNVMPYRISVGYTRENGILKTSYLDRWTGAINVNPKFFNNMLSLQLNVKGVYNKNRFADAAAIGAAAEFDPTQPIYSDNSPYGNGYYMSLKADGTPIDIGIANPLAILNQKHDESTVKRSIGNAQIDYRFHFLPDLRANLNLGYDVSSSDGGVYIDDNSPMSYVWGNYKSGWGDNKDYTQLKRNTLLDFYLNYQKEIGINKIDVMGGYSWQHFYRSESNIYPYSQKMQAETGNVYYKDGDNYSTESYLVSFFGRLNYTLLNRYLLTFTLRNDGSSRFSKDNRWGLFPAVALAWRMADEPFMKNQQVLSDLKLRVGYGVTGQQNLGAGDYPYLARYMYSKAGANYFFGDDKVALLRPLAYDQDLKWEETGTYNIGIDYGFLNNRISGALDLYHRKTKDLLNTVSVPAGSNYNNEVLTNVGELVNKGIEFSVTAHPVVTRDLDWSVSYNVAYNKNKITKLTLNDDPNYAGVMDSDGGITGGTGNKVIIHAVDKPYGSFYVYEQVYDNDGKPVEGAYVDQNGDGVIDSKDLIIYKKAAPDVTMGFSSQLTYKNWDFSFAMHASIGNYAYNNIQSNREAKSTIYDPSGFLKNRVNSASYTNFNETRFLSSYYVQNASFLRMDNISLGYTFVKPWNLFESIRLSATVQNPFVITKYDGLDPEINNKGIDNNIYPRPVSYVFGVSVNF